MIFLKRVQSYHYRWPRYYPFGSRILLFYYKSFLSVSNDTSIVDSRYYHFPCILGAVRISSNIDFQVKSIWPKIDLDHVHFQGLIPVIMEDVKTEVIPWTAFSRSRIMIRVIMENLCRYKVIWCKFSSYYHCSAVKITPIAEKPICFDSIYAIELFKNRRFELVWISINHWFSETIDRKSVV